MTENSPINAILENFNLSDITREVLGESPISGMTHDAALDALKQELIYCERQAKEGAEKSRHIFAAKADKLRTEIQQKEAAKNALFKAKQNNQTPTRFRSIEDLAKSKNMSVDELKKRFEIDRGADYEGHPIFSIKKERVGGGIDYKKLFNM